jgi:acyl-CoA thioesterase FadM
MNLYLVHCGFYDTKVSDGIYENHVNYFVLGSSFEEAKKKMKEKAEFRKNKMHVDGMQMIEVVDGHRVCFEKDAHLKDETVLVSYKHRELAAARNQNV